jgi:four helix bundle protein
MAKDRFSYQDLRVYEDMIQSTSLAEEVASGWDPVHAVADHFCRASEGALVCLAEACRTRHIDGRNEAVGHALGSILECAACFDIATCKSLCSQEESTAVKRRFSAVFRQLFALRSSWQESRCFKLREDSPEYVVTHVFNHERLKVYQLALQVNRRLASWRLLERLTRSEFRRIDEPATSIALNIAEGNGRFAHLDHGRFLEIANRSNTKLAARLEICALRGAIDGHQANGLIGLMVEIDRMTAKLAQVWRNQEG